MAAPQVLACGAEYDPHEDLLTSFDYDPDTASSRDSFYLFDHFIASQLASDPYHVRQMRDDASKGGERDFFSVLNRAIKDADRKILVMDEQHPEYSCYRNKYYKLAEKIRQLTISVKYSENNSAGISNNELNKQGYSIINYCYTDKNSTLDWEKTQDTLQTFVEGSEYVFVARVVLLWGNMVFDHHDKASAYLDAIKQMTLTDEQKSLVAELQVMYDDPMAEKDATVVTLHDPYDAEYEQRDAILIFMLAAINDKNLDDKTVVDLLQKRDRLGKAYKRQLKDFIATSFPTLDNDYDRYLIAAAYFYLDDYATAKPMFSALAANKSSPFAESSLYVLARIERFDVGMELYPRNGSNAEWEQHKIDYQKARAAAGERAFVRYNEYLKQYPNGQYVKAAKGMLRHCDWQAGRQDAFVSAMKIQAKESLGNVLHTAEWSPMDVNELDGVMAEYSYGIRMKNSEEFNSDEEQAKAESELSPLALLFTADMKVVVKAGSSNKDKSIARLYDFIDSLGTYQKRNYAAVIKRFNDGVDLLPPEQMLYVRALEHAKQYEKAIAYWSELGKKDNSADYSLKSNADYEIARIIVLDKGVKGLFFNPFATREVLKLDYLASLCDNNLQLELLNDKSISDANKHYLLADTATRYLYKQKFTELNDLFASQPDAVLQEFSGIRTAVKQVAENHDLGKAYMNIGYFMKQSLHPLITIPAGIKQEVVETCNQTTVDNGAAGPYYYFNKSASYFADDKEEAEAKVLHFLTMCGKNGEEGRSCMWGYEPPNGVKEDRLPWGYKPEQGITSEEAFNKLHKKYPDSKWAEQTPYYY